MKYINFRYAGFVVFEQSQTHKDMAERFPNDEVISAGFVNGTCDYDQISTHGESVTLKMSSRKSDGESIGRRILIYV